MECVTWFYYKKIISSFQAKIIHAIIVILLFVLLYYTFCIFLSVRNSVSLTLFREQLPMFPFIDLLMSWSASFNIIWKW